MKDYIIDVDLDDEEVYYINYYNISYCMNNYLYSRYPLENVIIIYRLKLIVNYNAENNTHTPIILKSKLLKKTRFMWKKNNCFFWFGINS